MDPGLNIKNQTSNDSNQQMTSQLGGCLLYTSDAADE